jgi:organic hydroperoxide reductase OsmC/OhrA
MQPFPHVYQVSSSGCPDSEVILSAAGLEPLRTTAPPEFDGPGGHWSPESLLVGAIVDCYQLTFRALARAARVPWHSLECTVDGTLDRERGSASFTGFHIRARLVVPEGADLDMAERTLRRAEEACLVSNSLTGRRELDTVVEVAAACGEVAEG